MDIKILGSGCHDCLRLELLVGQVLVECSSRTGYEGQRQASGGSSTD